MAIQLRPERERPPPKPRNHHPPHPSALRPEGQDHPTGGHPVQAGRGWVLTAKRFRDIRVQLQGPPSAGLQQRQRMDHPVPLRRAGEEGLEQNQSGAAPPVLLRGPELPHPHHPRVQPLELRDHLPLL